MNQPIKKRKTKLDKLKELLVKAQTDKDEALAEEINQMINYQEMLESFFANTSGAQSRRSSKPEHNLGKKTC
ncbi:MAG: hypothetical protein ACO30K_13630 [bacterium]